MIWIKIADDWNQPLDLCYLKRLLYQLCRNHCPWTLIYNSKRRYRSNRFFSILWVPTFVFAMNLLLLSLWLQLIPWLHFHLLQICRASNRRHRSWVRRTAGQVVVECNVSAAERLLFTLRQLLKANFRVEWSTLINCSKSHDHLGITNQIAILRKTLSTKLAPSCNYNYGFYVVNLTIYLLSNSIVVPRRIIRNHSFKVNKNSKLL